MGTSIQAGERVLLRPANGRGHIVEAVSGTKRVPGLGVLKLGDLAGRAWGSTLKVGSEEFLLLRPTLADHIGLIDRGAQIVLAKDAARIVLECGLHAGSRVAEAGVGSGALTMVLAHAVTPGGLVFAYDLRADHLQRGKRNVAAAGYDGAVEFKVGDVAQALSERNLDAVVLDLPEPERVVEPAKAALAPSGTFASYSPLVVQVERTVHALRAAGFLDVRTLELLERGWTVHERGSRPDTNMLAHTGFLTFARRA